MHHDSSEAIPIEESNEVPFIANEDDFAVAHFGSSLYPPLQERSAHDADDSTFVTQQQKGGSSTSRPSMGTSMVLESSASLALGTSVSASFVPQPPSHARGRAPKSPPPKEALSVEEEEQMFRPWNAQFQSISKNCSEQIRTEEGLALITDFEKEVQEVSKVLVEEWCLTGPPGATGSQMQLAVTPKPELVKTSSRAQLMAAASAENDGGNSTPRWLPAPPSAPNNKSGAPLTQKQLQALTPSDFKTIKPSNFDGDRYFHRGIHYLMITTEKRKEYYGSYENAHKAANLEVRMVRKLWHLNPTKGVDSSTNLPYTDLIALPLVATCSINGFCVFAVASMPIDKDTMLAGLNVSASTYRVCDDRRAHRMLEKVAKNLRFQPYYANKEHRESAHLEDFEQFVPLEAEVHRGRDGSVYLLSAAQYLPPIDVSFSSLLHEVTRDANDANSGVTEDILLLSPASPLSDFGSPVGSPRGIVRKQSSSSGAPTTTLQRKSTNNAAKERELQAIRARNAICKVDSKYARRRHRAEQYLRFHPPAIAQLPPGMIPTVNAFTSFAAHEDAHVAKEATRLAASTQLAAFMGILASLDLTLVDAAGNIDAFNGTQLKRAMHQSGIGLHDLGAVFRCLAAPSVEEMLEEQRKPELPPQFHPPPADSDERRLINRLTQGRDVVENPAASVAHRRDNQNMAPAAYGSVQFTKDTRGGEGPPGTCASPGNNNASGGNADTPQRGGGAPPPLGINMVSQPANNGSSVATNLASVRSPASPQTYASGATPQSNKKRYSVTSRMSITSPLSLGALEIDSNESSKVPKEFWLSDDAKTVAIEIVRIEAIARSVRALLREHQRSIYSVNTAHPEPVARPPHEAYEPGRQPSRLLDHLQSIFTGTPEAYLNNVKRPRKSLSKGLSFNVPTQRRSTAAPSVAEQLKQELTNIGAFAEQRIQHEERRLNRDPTTRSLDVSLAANKQVGEYLKDAEPLFQRESLTKTKDDEMREVIAQVLTLLFGDTAAAEHFWSSTVMSEVWSRYGTIGSVIELRNVNSDALLKRICELSGLDVRWPTSGRGGKTRVTLGSKFVASSIRSVVPFCKSIRDMYDQPYHDPRISKVPQAPPFEKDMSLKKERRLLAKLEKLERTHICTLQELTPTVAREFIACFEELCAHFSYLGRWHANNLALFRLRLKQMTSRVMYSEMLQLWAEFGFDGVVYAPCPHCLTLTNLSTCGVVSLGGHRCGEDANLFDTTENNTDPNKPKIDRGLFPVGLEDGRFPDTRILASSTAPGFSPRFCRLNLKSCGWAPAEAGSKEAEDGAWNPQQHTGSDVAQFVKPVQFLEVQLRAERVVSSIMVQGVGSNRTLNRFKLYYSPDAEHWVQYTGPYYHYDETLANEAAERLKQLDVEEERRRIYKTTELDEPLALREDIIYDKNLVHQTPRRKVNRPADIRGYYKNNANAPWQLEAEDVKYENFDQFGVMRGVKGCDGEIAKIDLLQPITCWNVRIVPETDSATSTSDVGFKLELLCADSPAFELNENACFNSRSTERISPKFIRWSEPVTKFRVSRNRPRLELAEQEVSILKELRELASRVFNENPYTMEHRRFRLPGSALPAKITMVRCSNAYITKLHDLHKLLKEWGPERAGDVPTVIHKIVDYSVLELELLHRREEPTAEKVAELVRQLHHSLQTFDRHRAQEVEAMLRRVHAVFTTIGNRQHLLRPIALAEIRWLGNSSTALPFLMELLRDSCQTDAEHEEFRTLCSKMHSDQLTNTLKAAKENAEHVVKPQVNKDIKTTPLSPKLRATRSPPSTADSRDTSRDATNPVHQQDPHSPYRPREQRNRENLKRLLKLESLQKAFGEVKRGKDVVSISDSPRDTFYGVLIGDQNPTLASVSGKTPSPRTSTVKSALHTSTSSSM